MDRPNLVTNWGLMDRPNLLTNWGLIDRPNLLTNWGLIDRPCLLRDCGLVDSPSIVTEWGLIGRSNLDAWGSNGFSKFSAGDVSVGFRYLSHRLRYCLNNKPRGICLEITSFLLVICKGLTLVTESLFSARITPYERVHSLHKTLGRREPKTLSWVTRLK